MKKRLIALLCIFVLAATWLAGCSSADTTTGQTTDNAPQTDTSNSDQEAAPAAESISFPLDETYTITAFAFSNTGQELDKSLFMQTMEEKTNIHWDMTTVSEAELVEKRNLSFNGGEYYDVYIKSGIDAVDAYKYGSQGILIPLNDLIDQYMPNLKAALDEMDAWKDITSADGNIYALPQLDGPGLAAPSCFVNEKWLEKVGLEVPTTQEEFLEVLRAFRDKDPNGNGQQDEYPIYCPAGAVEYTLPLFGVAMDYNTYSYYEDGEMTYVPTSEVYKEFLAFWANAYQEGLINQDCYTATWDDINAIGATSDTLGIIPTWGVYQHVGTERDEDYVNILPFNGAHSIPSTTGVQYGGLCITDRCTRPELICMWADYLYSQEGADLGRLGVEGKTYTLDENGMYYWNVDGEYGSDITTIRNTHTLYGWYPVPLIKSDLFDEGNTNEEELNIYKLRQEMLQYAAEPFPSLSWTAEEMEERAALVTTITSYISQYQAEVVTGQVDLESSWDQYLATLESMQVSRLNEIDRAAYTRWLSEQG